MVDKDKSRERFLLLFVIVLVIGAAYIVLLSTGVIEPDSAGFSPDPLEADTVTLRYEYGVSNSRVTVKETVTVTDRTAVRRVLSIRNSMLIKSTPKRMDNERYTLYFYQNGEPAEQWRVDANGITSFSTRNGTYIITSDAFDLDYIIQLLRE